MSIHWRRSSMDHIKQIILDQNLIVKQLFWIKYCPIFNLLCTTSREEEIEISANQHKTWLIRLDLVCATRRLPFLYTFSKTCFHSALSKGGQKCFSKLRIPEWLLRIFCKEAVQEFQNQNTSQSLFLNKKCYNHISFSLKNVCIV